MRPPPVRLSCLVMVLLVASFSAAQSGKHPVPEPSPDEAAMHDCLLTMDKVDRYTAAAKSLHASASRDPALAGEMKRIEDARVNGVGKAALIDKSPRTAAILKSQGLSAREFVLIPMTALTAAIAAAAQDAKAGPPAFVNPANIQFVRDHRAELKKLEVLGSSDSRGRNPRNQVPDEGR